VGTQMVSWRKELKSAMKRMRIDSSGSSCTEDNAGEISVLGEFADALNLELSTTNRTKVLKESGRQDLTGGLIQADAVMKLQSLWKGHRTRTMFHKETSSLRAFSVKVWVEGWDLKRTEANLGFKLIIWNLRTSERIFTKSVFGIKPRNTKFMLGKKALIPGMDEECVASVSLFDPKPGGIQFQAKLIDLEVFSKPKHNLKHRLKIWCSRYGIPGSPKTGPDDNEGIEINLELRSFPHSFSGWLWVSKGLKEAETIEIIPKPKAVNVKSLFLEALQKVKISFRGGSAKVHKAKEQSLARPRGSLSNPAPGKSKFDVRNELRGYAWECLWATLFDRKLYLFAAYGDLEPLFIINAEAWVKTQNLFPPPQNPYPEFAMCQKSKDSPLLLKGGQGGETLSFNEEEDSIAFVATSVSQAITWVGKIRSQNFR